MFRKYFPILTAFFFAGVFSFVVATGVFAQTRGFLTPTPQPELPAGEAVADRPLDETPTPEPKPKITEEKKETLGPLEMLLDKQKLGSVWPTNPIKYAIRAAVKAGVPANTLVLLLLMPIIASFIAAARHIVGLRGFGISLPAVLSVVFVAIGPVLGILLFVLMVVVSTLARMVMRKLRIKLQYLPRMALLLWFVVVGVLGVLFLAPIIPVPDFASVSIFPVLVLVLLAEDFSKIQIGKGARTAISLAVETIVLSLLSYILLTFSPLQRFTLLNPEWLLLGVIIFDILLGKYVGLRFIEYWKFRMLLKK